MTINTITIATSVVTDDIATVAGRHAATAAYKASVLYSAAVAASARADAAVEASEAAHADVWDRLAVDPRAVLMDAARAADNAAVATVMNAWVSADRNAALAVLDAAVEAARVNVTPEMDAAYDAAWREHVGATELAELVDAAKAARADEYEAWERVNASGGHPHDAARDALARLVNAAKRNADVARQVHAALGVGWREMDVTA